MHSLHLILLFLFSIAFSSCNGQEIKSRRITTGAERMEEYLPLIKNKRVAVVANQTSKTGNTHLVDTLLSLGVNVEFVFAPEHGFRGELEAGASVTDGIDKKTGLPVKSLYGANKKPRPDDIKRVDIVVFDIQDVGTRFYTYISTLQYIMEACAKEKVPVLVLDRPNPNGHYVDGPVLDTAYRSFVGMNPIPVVHGLTVAEYALMLNGEKWLEGGMQCELFYVKNLNWDHSVLYRLPVAPSPNLPSMSAIYLYPSLCFFEGTNVSVGRGTEFPFQVIGMPGFRDGNYEFTPQRIPGKAEKPLHEGKLCKGYDLREFGEKFMRSAGKLYIYWLLEFYNKSDKETFFNDFFDTLAGSDELRKQIMQGLTEEQIAASWKEEIDAYKLIRLKYLLYKDFK